MSWSNRLAPTQRFERGQHPQTTKVDPLLLPVDAKGRTVSVWNADNIGGGTPSIAFALDGFGRMRTTTLKGQSQVITATYDALGRQLTLSDPDKGN